MVVCNEVLNLQKAADAELSLNPLPRSVTSVPPITGPIRGTTVESVGSAIKV